MILRVNHRKKMKYEIYRNKFPSVGRRGPVVFLYSTNTVEGELENPEFGLENVRCSPGIRLI